MKRITTILLVTAVLVGLTWLWPSSHAATRSVELQGPVMKAHFVNVGQANATLLEFPCGVVLVDAGAQDDEHVDGLVDFITSLFDARPALWPVRAVAGLLTEPRSSTEGLPSFLGRKSAGS